MGLETRSQRSLRLALELVRSLEGEEPEVKEIYGALCHSFPVMVRQCGLVQALAFAAGKAALGEEGGEGGGGLQGKGARQGLPAPSGSRGAGAGSGGSRTVGGAGGCPPLHGANPSGFGDLGLPQALCRERPGSPHGGER